MTSKAYEKSHTCRQMWSEIFAIIPTKNKTNIPASPHGPAGFRRTNCNEKLCGLADFAVNKNEICLAETAEITEILFPNTRSALATLHT